MRIGEIAELWVYPVKSMRGVRVSSVALDPEGIRGDRRFAIESCHAPAGKPLLTGRERASMLLYRPESDGEVQRVEAPDGRRFPLSSAELLRHFAETDNDQNSRFDLLRSPNKPLTDVRAVSLVSTATLAAINEEMERPFDPRRFRSNIVIKLDGAAAFAEDAWSGRTLRFGEGEDAAELRILERIPRCRMVSLDPQTAEPDNNILRHLARHHEGRAGIYASVFKAGLLAQHQSMYWL